MAQITCPRCSRTNVLQTNYGWIAGGVLKLVCQFCALDLADNRADTSCRGGNYNSRDVGASQAPSQA